MATLRKTRQRPNERLGRFAFRREGVLGRHKTLRSRAGLCGSRYGTIPAGSALGRRGTPSNKARSYRIGGYRRLDGPRPMTYRPT
jgi:hypothetical protein